LFIKVLTVAVAQSRRKPDNKQPDSTMAEKIEFSASATSDSDSGRFNKENAKAQATPVVSEKSDTFESPSDPDRDYGDNPFSDPDVADYYVALYEKSQYECRHVFDPTLEWSKEEERKLVRKLDWHVCLWACIMFFALQVDRGNLSQAVSDNLLEQLNLTTNGEQFFLSSTISDWISSSSSFYLLSYCFSIYSRC
jgi:hypothetical protein